MQPSGDRITHSNAVCICLHISRSGRLNMSVLTTALVLVSPPVATAKKGQQSHGNPTTNVQHITTKSHFVARKSSPSKQVTLVQPPQDCPTGKMAIGTIDPVVQVDCHRPDAVPDRISGTLALTGRIPGRMPIISPTLQSPVARPAQLQASRSLMM